MYSTLPCERLPKNRRICLSWSIFCMHTSFRTEFAASGCFFRSTIFMATASPVCRLISSFTLHPNIGYTIVRGLVTDIRRLQDELQLQLQRWCLCIDCSPSGRIECAVCRLSVFGRTPVFLEFPGPGRHRGHAH